MTRFFLSVFYSCAHYEAVCDICGNDGDIANGNMVVLEVIILMWREGGDDAACTIARHFYQRIDNRKCTS